MSTYRKFTAIALVAASTLMWTARADDDGKSEVKKVEDRKEESVKSKYSSTVKEKREGNVFVNFWIHTVGGTIGNGLKTGAGKIKKTFD